jgi:hypothetical protein
MIICDCQVFHFSCPVFFLFFPCFRLFSSQISSGMFLVFLFGKGGLRELYVQTGKKKSAGRRGKMGLKKRPAISVKGDDRPLSCGVRVGGFFYAFLSAVLLPFSTPFRECGSRLQKRTVTCSL